MTARTILCLILSLAATPAFADPPAAVSTEPTLSVKGAGTVEVKPDFARLSVSVSETRPTLAAATAALPEKSEKALALLKSLEGDGVTIERSDYRVVERRYNGYSPLPAGTKPPEPTTVASMSYSLKVAKLASLSGIISKINNAGAFEIGWIHFQVADERAVYNQARRSAVADAMNQAATYADAAEQRLGGLITIADGEVSPRDGMADLGVPTIRQITIIPPATLTFYASVTMTWRIAPKG